MSKIEQLKELKNLLDEGVINVSEFEQMKTEILSASNTKEKDENSSESPIDYKITNKIGFTQWMVENLNEEKFRNGDKIPEAKTREEWLTYAEKKQAAWCYHEENPNNEKGFGKIYNGYALDDQRGLAPKGWRIPTESEWNFLIQIHGGEETAGKNMKSSTGWIDDEEGNNGNGTNELEFNALAGGYRDFRGLFRPIGEYTSFWVIGKKDDDNYGNRINLYNSLIEAEIEPGQKASGFYVRCINEEAFGNNANSDNLVQKIIEAYDELDVDYLEDDDNVETNKSIVRKFINYITTEDGRNEILEEIEDLEEDGNEYIKELIRLAEIVNNIYKSGVTKLLNEEGKQKFPFALDRESIQEYLQNKENSLGDRMSKLIDVVDNIVDRIEN
jgi:uncharacterized protein (TIGR02145 family)